MQSPARATMAPGPSTTTRPSRPPPRRRVRWGWWILGAILLALGVFLILFRWNWLRGPLAHEISHRLNRPVAITGNLEVHPWSWSPSATVNGLVIGNAPWAGTRPLASLPRLTVQVKILPLLQGKVILPLVEADQPDVGLLRDAQGRANWNFHPDQPPKPLQLPAINHLIIEGGALRFSDLKRKLFFTGTVSTNEQVVGYGRGAFALNGQGTLNGERFVARVTGGPLVNVDPSRPYDFDSHIEAGATRIGLAGRFDHPFDFGAITGRFSVAGPDLADLYRVTGLALPNTPPYSIAADFSRRASVYALSAIRGRAGQSDLEGALTVDDHTGRPDVKGALSSRRLRLVDLATVVGGVPKRAAPGTLSPFQQAESARLKTEHRLLPDAHLQLDRVRGMDAQVDYRADSVDAGRMAVQRLRLDVGLDHGLLTIDPLDLTLPQGRLSGSVRIDARRSVPADAVDLRLTNASLQQLVTTKGKGPPPLAGALYARMRLSGTGDSVRAAAASANGAVTFVIPSGDMRQSLAELTGINVANGLYLLLTKSKKDTPIRCGVADFQARQGVLQLDQGILDTEAVRIEASGDIDLRDEALKLQLSGKPKHFRFLRLNAPITLTGSMAQPKVGVQIAKAAPQAAISVAIGVLAAPLAAVLPFVNPGLAKNADCGALTAQASGEGVRLRGARTATVHAKP